MIEWIAEQCGGDALRLPAWRRALFEASGAQRKAAPHLYRDLDLDPALVAQAAAQGNAAWQQSKEADDSALARL